MKPIVLHTGNNLSSKEKRKREKQENHFFLGRKKFIVPEALSDRAKRKFRQISKDAFWLDALSTDILAVYCDAWDKWLSCVEAMQGTPEVEVVDTPRSGRVAKQNPHRQALRTYIAIMEECSSKLGLTNIDRLKLQTPVDEDGVKQSENKNPFEEFMAKVE